MSWKRKKAGVPGNIRLQDFVERVRGDLEQAQKDPEHAFFRLKSVELEVSFGLDIVSENDFKLLVFDAGVNISAKQTHTVRLNLEPLGASTTPSDPPDNTTAVTTGAKQRRGGAVASRTDEVLLNTNQELDQQRVTVGDSVKILDTSRSDEKKDDSKPGVKGKRPV